MKYIFLIILCSLILISPVYGLTKTEAGGWNIFPTDNFWNTRIDNTTLYPKLALSDTYVTNNMGASGYVWPFWSNGAGMGYDIVTNATAPEHDIWFLYAGQSDYTYGGTNGVWKKSTIKYRIPDTYSVEAGADKHVFILNTDTGFLYEIFTIYPMGDSGGIVGFGATDFRAHSGAIYNLSSNQMRGAVAGTTNIEMDGHSYPVPRLGGNVGGISQLAGEISIGELNAGEIKHAIGLAPNYYTNPYVWPARGAVTNCPVTPCMPGGTRWRLKASYDISGFPPQAKVIATAMKQYGLIVTDGGLFNDIYGSWKIGGFGKANGVPITSYNFADINTLKNIKGTDLEAVDVTGSIVNLNSGQVLNAPHDPDPTPPVDPYGTDPYAGYTPANISGVAPVTVQFTDISWDNPNNVTVWIWSFKDVSGTGNNTWTIFNTTESSQYTFTDAGNYSINLTAGNAYGYNITPFTAFVNISANIVTPPSAFFDANPRSGPSPLTVYFNDLSSSGTPTSWNWSFGDGNYSNYQDPAHTYNSTGAYSVSLTACNDGGCTVHNRNAYINVNTLVASNFTSNVTTGFVPLPVAFTDLSTNSPTTWSWNFGDGGWSYIQNPTYTYTVAGTYPVQLTACNGTDCNTKSGYNITASAVVTDFSGTPLSGTLPLSVQFTDLSTNTPDRWEWEWSNDTGATWYEFTYTSQKNPLQTFSAAGTYTIKMAAGTNMSTWYYKTKYNYITVSAAPTPTPTTVPPTTVPTTVAPPTTVPTTVPPGTGGSGWSPHMRDMAVTTMATIPAQRLDNITEALFGGWNETNQSPDWEPIITNSVAVYTDFLGPVAFLLIFLIPFGMMWLAHGNMKLLSILGIIVGLFIFAYLPANFVAAAIICICVAGATLVWSLFKQ